MSLWLILQAVYKDSSEEALTIKFDLAIQEYFKSKHFSKNYSVLSLSSPGSHNPEEVTDKEVNDTK